jgi:hypothetical protein
MGPMKAEMIPFTSARASRFWERIAKISSVLGSHGRIIAGSPAITVVYGKSGTCPIMPVSTPKSRKNIA